MKLLFAKEFTRYPFGRNSDDGEFNGQAFRDLLVQRFQEAQKKNEALEVVIDDVRALGGSFISEAFGGFAKKMQDEGVMVSEKNLHITGNSSHYYFYINKIWSSIRKWTSEDAKTA